MNIQVKLIAYNLQGWPSNESAATVRLASYEKEEKKKDLDEYLGNRLVI